MRLPCIEIRKTEQSNFNFSIAGMRAKTASQAMSAGRTFVDPSNGQTKFKLNTDGVRFNDGITIGQQRPGKGAHHDVTLKSLIHFPELFESYPELENLRVRLANPRKEVNYYRYFMPKHDEHAPHILLNMRELKDMQTALSTLMHEVQHAIQHKEDFAQGQVLQAHARAVAQSPQA